MTTSEIERQEAICRRASSGPWRTSDSAEADWLVATMFFGVADQDDKPRRLFLTADNIRASEYQSGSAHDDVTFCAEARACWPECLAEIRRLEKENTLLRQCPIPSSFAGDEIRELREKIERLHEELESYRSALRRCHSIVKATGLAGCQAAALFTQDGSPTPGPAVPYGALP